LLKLKVTSSEGCYGGFETHVPYSEAQTDLVAERATVNILNSAREPTQADHIAAVKKHFEIPVSLAALPGMDAHMYGQEVEYPQLSGRRSILA
jgi:hypothetical protein